MTGQTTGSGLPSRKIEAALVLIEKVIGDIGYTSFKDECGEDEDYHYALTRVWSIMYNYQQRME